MNWDLAQQIFSQGAPSRRHTRCWGVGNAPHCILWVQALRISGSYPTFIVGMCPHPQER